MKYETTIISDSQFNPMAREIVRLGLEGWELKAVSGLYAYLQRPIYTGMRKLIAQILKGK